MTHIADNQDALLDYLYEEGDPSERLKIARHLQTCAGCSVAVLELQTVRGMLADWKPPASQLGFRIVQDAPPRHAWWPPAIRSSAWAQAAAALLVFAAGLAVSQLEVDYGAGALTVRTRSAEPDAAAGRNTSILLPASVNPVGPVLTGTATDDQPTAASASRDETASTEQLLQRVRAMIDQSETRQQRELALRLSQVAREVDTQQQADLLHIHQNLGQQQEMMDYLVRTSGGTK